MINDQEPRMPGGGEQKDPFQEAADKIKSKFVAGKFVFDNVVLPKAKEVLETAKNAAEDKLNQVRDSFDPTRGLARNAVEARDWLVGRGLSVKRANEIIIATVTKTVKEAKPGKDSGKNA